MEYQFPICSTGRAPLIVGWTREDPTGKAAGKGTAICEGKDILEVLKTVTVRIYKKFSSQDGMDSDINVNTSLS